MNAQKNNGYIAITTALIFGLLALFLAVSLGTTTLLARSGWREVENKKASYFLAHSCLETALLRMGQDYNYMGNETVTVGSDQCTIMTIEISGQNSVIKSRAVVGGATTNLKLAVDKSLSRVTLEEVTKF